MAKCKQGCTCKRHEAIRRAQKLAAEKKRVERVTHTCEREGCERTWSERINSNQSKRFCSTACSNSGPDKRRVRASGEFFSGGYHYLTMQVHPLALDGVLAEHRKVLYDKIGPGPHACHWGCGRILEWGGRSGIQADHLDWDKLNNDPSNLVPSCLVCNKDRLPTRRI